jgi:hypothetical protein
VLAYNLWFAEDTAPAPIVFAKPATTPAEAPASPAVDAPTAPAAATPQPTASPAPVVVDKPQSMPGQLIAKAQKAVAAHDAAMTKPANEVLAASDPATAPEPAAPLSTEEASVPAAPPAPAEVQRPEPSANFKAYVVNLKVNGVFQGENARAMLNGKMYRLGEVVDPKLGIVFLRLEPEDKRIVFEDSKGAIMSRRY